MLSPPSDFRFPGRRFHDLRKTRQPPFDLKTQIPPIRDFLSSKRDFSDNQIRFLVTRRIGAGKPGA